MLMKKMDNHLVLIYHAFEVATHALTAYYKLVHSEESIEAIEDGDPSKFPIALLQQIWKTFETHLLELIAVVNGIKIPLITASYEASGHNDEQKTVTGAGTASRELKASPGTHYTCERKKVKLHQPTHPPLY